MDSDLVSNFNELYQKYLNLFPKGETTANKDRVKLTEEQVKEWYDKQELTQLFKRPHPKARKLYNHYSESTPYHTLEIDLLFMPHDNGFKYILSVVDVASRYKWGVALRNKQSDYVLERFKTLDISYSKIQQISSDAGGEFSSIIKWAEEKGIKYHKVEEPSHHLSMVENLNKLLAVKLFQKQTLQELETGKVNKKWVGKLQKVLDKLNNIYNKAIRMKPSEAIKKAYVQQQTNQFSKLDEKKL